MEPELFPKHPVLIVDDDKSILDSISFILSSKGINNIKCCQDSRNVMKMFDTQKEFSVVLLDLIMPYVGGDKLFQLIDSEYPQVPIIILTAVEELNSMFKKIKNDSFEYLVKGCSSEKIVEKVRQAINYRTDFPNIVTNCKKMWHIFKKIRNAAKANIDILITGEAGVGKMLAAEAIHRLSTPKGKFKKLDISSKGGQIHNNKFQNITREIIKDIFIDEEGKIKCAENGTLYIEKLGELSKESQKKLLRLVRDKLYYPIDAESPMITDARIILSSRSDLKSLMESKKFREDLYYKLFEHQIHIPSLRERKEDIPVLVENFVIMGAKEYGNNIPKVTDEAYDILLNYNYPGNVRELKNIITRIINDYHDLPELPLKVFEKEILSIKKKNKKIKFGQFVNTSFEFIRKLKGNY
jgi:DNA-binding NtrC family response regulator